MLAGKTKSKSTPTTYVTVDDFLESAKVMYNLDSLEIAGFKAFVSDSPVRHTYSDCVKPREKYLGRKGE